MSFLASFSRTAGESLPFFFEFGRADLQCVYSNLDSSLETNDEFFYLRSL